MADDTTNERRLRESVERLEAVTPRYTSDDATLIGPDGPERQVGSIADLHPERCPMTEHSPPQTECDDECSGLCGEHHWLDRPESDTRECLICGAEVAG